MRELSLLTRKGNILNIVNTQSGLAVNDVKQIYQDRNKNIWCALNNGISRIDYSSPLSFYKEESGIQGSANTVIRYMAVFISELQMVYTAKD